MIRFSIREPPPWPPPSCMLPAVSACGIQYHPDERRGALEAASGPTSSRQYQRRADLIPNLVATVQGAAIARNAPP